MAALREAAVMCLGEEMQRARSYKAALSIPPHFFGSNVPPIFFAKTTPFEVLYYTILSNSSVLSNNCFKLNS